MHIISNLGSFVIQSMEDKIVQARARLYKSGALFLLVLSIVGVAYFFSVLKQYHYIGRNAPSNITVSGTGEVVVIPDIATVSYAVTEEAKTAAEAQQLTARKGNDVKVFLKEKKIADKDIKTIEYSISPKYEYTYKECPPGQFPSIIVMVNRLFLDIQ